MRSRFPRTVRLLYVRLLDKLRQRGHFQGVQLPSRRIQERFRFHEAFDNHKAAVQSWVRDQCTSVRNSYSNRVVAYVQRPPG